MCNSVMPAGAGGGSRTSSGPAPPVAQPGGRRPGRGAPPIPGGRMDTTQLLKGVLDLAVLAVVSDEDGYGYDVVRRLRAAGIEEVGDASVYGTLRRLYSS